MNVVKAHKFTFISLGVILVILIVGFLILRTLLPDYGKGYYGNRLEDIQKYTISNDTINRLKSELEQKEGIKKVDYHLEGRLIGINISVDSKLDKAVAKENANVILSVFTKEELSYYDIEVFLLSEEESEVYPTIGYKHKTSDAFVWAA